MSTILRAKLVAPSTGMAEVDCVYFGEHFMRQLWVRCKARRPTRCAKTSKAIETGDLVFRPFGNKANRSMRVLAQEIET